MAGHTPETSVPDSSPRPLPILLFLTATVAWMIAAFLLAGPFVGRFFSGLVYDLPFQPVQNLNCPAVVPGEPGQIAVTFDSFSTETIDLNVTFNVSSSSESAGYTELCTERITVPGDGSAEATCTYTLADLPESASGGWHLTVNAFPVDSGGPIGSDMAFHGRCFLRTQALVAKDLLTIAMATLPGLALAGWGAFLWRRRGIAARILILLACLLIWLELIVFHGFAWYGLSAADPLMIAAGVVPIVVWAAVYWLARRASRRERPILE